MQHSHKLQRLICDVQDLLTQLGDEQGPEVEALRARVADALWATKRALSAQNHNGHAAARVGRFVNSWDDFVTHYPRLAFTAGAIVAATIGYLAGVAHRK